MTFDVFPRQLLGLSLNSLAYHFVLDADIAGFFDALAGRQRRR